MALAAVASQTFDLVLMDVQMPEMDGLEADGRHSRRANAPAAATSPIIAMTAHALKGDRERCLEAGMDEYLSKPIHRAAVVGDDRAGRAAAPPRWQRRPKRTAMDWSAVLKATRGDRKLLGSSSRRLWKNHHGLLAAIREAIAAGDRTALRLSAHTLKGSVHYFGATAVFELACRLERMGHGW